MIYFRSFTRSPKRVPRAFPPLLSVLIRCDWSRKTHGISVHVRERRFPIGKGGWGVKWHDQRITPCLQREINKMAVSLEQRELCLVKQVSWGGGGVIWCVVYVWRDAENVPMYNTLVKVREQTPLSLLGCTPPFVRDRVSHWSGISACNPGSLSYKGFQRLDRFHILCHILGWATMPGFWRFQKSERQVLTDSHLPSPDNGSALQQNTEEMWKCQAHLL